MKPNKPVKQFKSNKNDSRPQQQQQQQRPKGDDSQQQRRKNKSRRNDSNRNRPRRNDNQIRIQNKIIPDAEPLIITIEEDLTHPYVSKFKEQAISKINAGKIKLIFNCAAVNTIASAGFALLLGILRITRNFGGELKLTALKPNITDLMKSVHLDLSFEIFPDDETALKSYKEKTETQFRLEKRKRIKELLKKSYLEDDSTEPLY